MTRKQKFVAICSNASCKYSYDYTFDDKIRHPSGCPRCGQESFVPCPHCKETLLVKRTNPLPSAKPIAGYGSSRNPRTKKAPHKET